MADPFLGEIRMVGFNFNPYGWALCQGQVVPLNQYQALYALFGTYYGGDGQSTIGLPDFQGRMPIGYGAGAGLPQYPIGSKAGAAVFTQSTANMPIHTHPMTVALAGIDTEVVLNVEANLATPTAGAYLALPNDGNGNNINLFHVPNNPDGTPIPRINLGQTNVAVTGTVTAGTTGASQAFSLMNPYTAVNFIVALQGIFPTRN